MKGVANALKMFKLDNGVYPTEDEGFKSLVTNPNPTKYTHYSSEGYLSMLPKDAWGNNLIYVHDKDGIDIITDAKNKKVISLNECPK